MYNEAVGLPNPRLRAPKYGIRVWHPLPDLRALRSYRREGHDTGVIRSLLHHQRFTVFSWRDPMPSITDHRRWLVRLLRRRLRRAARLLQNSSPSLRR